MIVAWLDGSGAVQIREMLEDQVRELADTGRRRKRFVTLRDGGVGTLHTGEYLVVDGAVVAPIVENGACTGFRCDQSTLRSEP